MKNIIGGFTMAVLAVCLALPNLVFAGADYGGGDLVVTSRQ
jgi:hypothetical protein